LIAYFIGNIKDVLPNINRMQTAKMAEKYRFCPWWPWPSNTSEWGTKHVFRVNLMQIHQALPEIFHTQTKNPDWRHQKTTFRSSLHVVKSGRNC